MNDERDELIERVAEALKALPPMDARAAARIVLAVRARKAAGPRRWERLVEWMRAPALSVASAGALAAAALTIGFVTRGVLATQSEPAASAASPVALAPLTPVARTREVPVPITFDAAGAKSVAIVGDFNDWDATAAPLTRFGPNGPWTTTIAVTPGRHLYAFMVDGKLVVDPRAPHARDPDYGGDASVLMVNTP